MADNKLIPPSKNKLPWYEQALSMDGRAAFLPFQDTLPGSVMNQRSFALPGIIAGAANAITAPGRAYSGSDPMFDPQEEAANFALNMLGGGVGASRAAPPPAGSLGMHTWHGSPHRFPPTAKNPLGEFDPTKIGTGEGAQAYGVGAGYLAESPAVAKTYNVGQRDLIKSVQAQLDAVNTALNVEYRKSGSFDATKDARQLSRRQNNLRKELEEVKQGNLYKVDLPDEQIAKMLDWDKPLSQQVDLGQKISPESLGLTYKQLENGNHAFVNSEGKILGNLQKNGSKESFTKNWIENVLRGSGRDLYNQLGQGMGGGAKVSEALRHAGIPGIRYLDQGSRPNTNSIAGIQANLDKAIARLKDWQGNTSSLGESQRKMFSEQVASFRKILQDAQNNPATSNFVVFDPKHMNIIGRE